jgi:hypothetical protein
MGMVGQERVETAFSVERMAERTAALYQEFVIH